MDSKFSDNKHMFLLVVRGACTKFRKRKKRKREGIERKERRNRKKRKKE
jgi:hypothetical protein